MHIMIHPDDDVYNVPPVMISSSAADWIMISHHGAGQQHSTAQATDVTVEEVAQLAALRERCLFQVGAAADSNSQRPACIWHCCCCAAGESLALAPTCDRHLLQEQHCKSIAVARGVVGTAAGVWGAMLCCAQGGRVAV